MSAWPQLSISRWKRCDAMSAAQQFGKRHDRGHHVRGLILLFVFHPHDRGTASKLWDFGYYSIEDQEQCGLIFLHVVRFTDAGQRLTLDVKRKAVSLCFCDRQQRNSNSWLCINLVEREKKGAAPTTDTQNLKDVTLQKTITSQDIKKHQKNTCK